MVKDYIKDTDGDMLVKDGDFVIAESDGYHIEDLLRAEKGEYKQHPLTGCAILNYINAPLTRDVKTKLEKEIRTQLKTDGFTIYTVKVNDFENIEINAEIE